MNLKIDYCSYKAAKWAVEHWHYSKTMPAGKIMRYGVWEDDKFIGAVIYGRGANNNSAKFFKVKVTECCELVRVALTTHQAPVTRIVAITLKMLARDNPGLKIVFSYADETNQGHKGIIYKAGNWEYLGKRVATGGHWIIEGKLVHNRSISSKYGARSNIPPSVRAKMTHAPAQVKHLFLYKLRQ